MGQRGCDRHPIGNDDRGHHLCTHEEQEQQMIDANFCLGFVIGTGLVFATMVIELVKEGLKYFREEGSEDDDDVQ